MESAAIFKNTISQMDFKKSILWYLKVSHNGTKREWENICKTKCIYVADKPGNPGFLVKNNQKERAGVIQNDEKRKRVFIL